jgi:hypothetical protein
MMYEIESRFDIEQVISVSTPLFVVFFFFLWTWIDFWHFTQLFIFMKLLLIIL